MLRHFPSQYVSFKHLNGRRLAECPGFKFADDPDLAGSNGVNVLSSSCSMGSDVTVPLNKLQIHQSIWKTG